jgi:hypothetical protein
MKKWTTSFMVQWGKKKYSKAVSLTNIIVSFFWGVVVVHSSCAGAIWLKQCTELKQVIRMPDILYLL